MQSDKSLKKAINNPDGLRFTEFQNLLEAHGFVCARSKASHFTYCSDKYRRSLPVQDNNGKAKGYQVKQFLRILEENYVI